MARSGEKKMAEFKAGIFIIASLALLIFALLWLRYFSVMPSMVIKAQFDDPGYIPKGVIVYYKGVNIGKVSKIYFSPNFKHTILRMDIYEKGLKLPANVYAAVQMEGITGQKHIGIIYPDNPSNKLLADGAMIEGRAPFGIEELQSYFAEQVKSGKLQKMFDDLGHTLANANVMTRTINNASKSLFNLIKINGPRVTEILQHGSMAAENFNDASKGISSFVTDPELKRDIKQTVSSTSEAVSGINQLVGDGEIKSGIKGSLKSFCSLGDLIKGFTGPLSNQDSNLFSNLNSFLQDVNQSGLIGNASITVTEANKLLSQTNCALGQVGAGGGFKDIADTIQNTNQAAKRIDCLGKGVSQILSKRFPLLRMMFGKPGASLEECECIGAPQSPPASNPTAP